jgi:hypothetical protein
MLQAALKKHEGVLKLWPPKSFKLFVMYYKQGQNMVLHMDIYIYMVHGHPFHIGNPYAMGIKRIVVNG